MSKKQLPSWLKGFRLDNYSHAASMTPGQWADQIMFRRHIDLMLALLANGDRSDSALNEYVPTLLVELLENPIGDHHYSMRSRGHVLNAPQRTVFPLTVFDLENLLDQIVEINRSEQRETGSEEGLVSVDSYFSDSSAPPLADYARINVDLTASDAEIRKDFDEWLRSKRAGRALSIKSPMLTEAKVAGWCKYGLLAYKDVELIKRWKGAAFTDEQRIELVRANSEAFDMPSTLKRTKANANALFSRQMAQALTYQITWISSKRTGQFFSEESAL